MFKKLIASMGAGAAKVDLMVNQTEYHLGETVTGSFHIVGGDVPQTINRISVGFYCEYRTNGEVKVNKVADIHCSNSFEIHSGEIKTIPFNYKIPYTLPITSSSVHFYFDTVLDIAKGVDDTDKDYITLHPTEQMSAVFSAIQTLGFQMKHSSGEIKNSGQEFEFAPITGEYYRKVEEIEIYFNYTDSGISLYLEVDKNFSFNKERQNIFTIPYEVLSNVEETASMIKEQLDYLLAYSGNHIQYPGSDHHYNQQYNHHSEHSDGHHHKSSSNIGAFAMGAVGGIVAAELLDEFSEEIFEDNPIAEAFEDFADDFGFGDSED